MAVCEGWAEHATQQLISETESNLRQCAQKWLQEKSILHSFCATARLAKTVIASTASDSASQRQMQVMRATFLL